MIVTRVRRLRAFQIKNKIKKALEAEVLDYRLNKVIDDLCDEGLFEYDNRKVTPKLRFTFPLFLVCIIVIFIVSCIKWLIAGNSYFDEENLCLKKMIAWDRYCKFNFF
jgi:hypothetical protein